MRAYALQDQGFDTVDANLRLGFDDDERDFGVAAAHARGAGQTRVRLLTNNPRKVAALEERGIDVAERVPLQVGANPHNAAYLADQARPQRPPTLAGERRAAPNRAVPTRTWVAPIITAVS